MRQMVRLGQVELEYALTGEASADTIIFVHGLGANLSQFEGQHAFFSHDYQVLSVSLRGHGQSGFVSSPTPAEYGLQQLATDIIYLLAVLRIEKVHYVGNSMGGTLGYEILKQKPALLASLSTFGTTARLSTSAITLCLLKLSYKLLSRAIIGNLARTAGQSRLAKRKIKQMMSGTAKSTLLHTLPHLAQFDYLPVIANSVVPCMIIKGGRDKEINAVMDTTIQAFEQRGNFSLVELAHAGHFANLDEPSQFNQAVQEFITSQTVGTSPELKPQ